MAREVVSMGICDNCGERKPEHAMKMDNEIVWLGKPYVFDLCDYDYGVKDDLVIGDILKFARPVKVERKKKSNVEVAHVGTVPSPRKSTNGKTKKPKTKKGEPSEASIRYAEYQRSDGSYYCEQHDLATAKIVGFGKHFHAKHKP